LWGGMGDRARQLAPTGGVGRGQGMDGTPMIQPLFTSLTSD